MSTGLLGRLEPPRYEIHLWLWQLTDEHVKHRTTRYRLTEERARKTEGPGRGRKLARDSEAAGVDERLSKIAAEVLAGKHIECAWELFRVQHFPGWEHREVAAALGTWAGRHGIEVTFEGRTVRDQPVIWVSFNV